MGGHQQGTALRPHSDPLRAAGSLQLVAAEAVQQLQVPHGQSEQQTTELSFNNNTVVHGHAHAHAHRHLRHDSLDVMIKSVWQAGKSDS